MSDENCGNCRFWFGGSEPADKMHPECLEALQEYAEGGHFDYRIYGG